MRQFTIIDSGPAFDGASPALFPLGGAESAVISLAQSLAARGNDVTVLNNCIAPIDHEGVRWRRLGCERPQGFLIVNRDASLLWQAPHRRRAALWLHNDARYLRKPRHLAPIVAMRPHMVFLSRYHARTWPLPFRIAPMHVIPLGVEGWFKRPPSQRPRKPRAIFSSNPERGLAPLLDIWVRRIRPAVPEAELHLFTRADFYGTHSRAAERARPVVEHAAALHSENVILRGMTPRPELAASYDDMRAMLYWGDPSAAETFCLSIAEAQAASIPCVARPLGALSERVVHGRSGYLESEEDRFAAAAIALLSNDAVWRQCSEGALQSPQQSWDETAARFEALDA